MEKKKSNKKLLAVSAIVLLVIAAALAIIYTQFIDKPSDGEKNITVEITFSQTNKKTVEINTDSQFLRGALEEKKLVAGTESEYGLFVKTVDGVTVDDAKEEWWCFTKGGATLMTGIDSTPIANGDKFEITLTTGYGG